MARTWGEILKTEMRHKEGHNNFADRCGYSPGYLTRWFSHGAPPPPLETIYNVGQRLGKSDAEIARWVMEVDPLIGRLMEALATERGAKSDLAVLTRKAKRLAARLEQLSAELLDIVDGAD